MSDGKIIASFRCLTCDQKVELSLPEGYDDESIASCKNCGQKFGRFGDIKAKALEGMTQRLFQEVGVQPAVREKHRA